MTPQQKFYIGIDVSKDSFCVAAAREGMAPGNWRSLKARSFDSTEAGVLQFMAWLKDLGGEIACLCAESTGPYSWRLAALFEKAGIAPRLSIVNPRWPLGTADSLGIREKTDASDAAILAIHALIHRPEPTERSRAQHELRELFRAREAIVADATAMKNRIHASNLEAVRKEYAKALAALEKTIERLDREIDRRIKKEETFSRDFKLLDSVPGIGRLLAIAILAELGDLRQWTRGQIISYTGLFPRAHESGTSVKGKPRMAKRSNSRVRACLFLAALADVTPRGLFKDYHKGLVERGKAKMQSIGAVMRKLLVLARAVVISGKPFDPSEFGASAT